MATVEKTLILVNKVGLHARPAALFVQTAARFQASVRVVCNGRQADAKRILPVLQLGAEQGSVLRLFAEGPDADEAINALTRLVQERFGDPE